jgi:hypothetical protein
LKPGLSWDTPEVISGKFSSKKKAVETSGLTLLYCTPGQNAWTGPSRAASTAKRGRTASFYSEIPRAERLKKQAMHDALSRLGVFRSSAFG